MRCIACWLDTIEYRESCVLQESLLVHRQRGEIADTLLLLEHPPTITAGKFSRVENIKASRADLEREGISLYSSDRGGDVTYHGPGQLVGYPIMNIRERGVSLRQYVFNLEETIIRTLADFQVDGVRDSTHPGVWVKGKSIAAIGLRVRRWVTMHGFAFNVCPCLTHFSFINPCGNPDGQVTSVSRQLGRRVLVEEVVEKLLPRFGEVFGGEIEVKENISVLEGTRG